MATATDTLNLLNSRVTWLEGKGRELQTAWNEVLTAMRALEQRVGTRPTGTGRFWTRLWTTAIPIFGLPYTLYRNANWAQSQVTGAVGPEIGSADDWERFDREWAPRVSEKVRLFTEAVRRYNALAPSMDAVTFTLAQTGVAQALTDRGNAALNAGQPIVEQYLESPLVTFDPQRSATESAFRQLYSGTPFADVIHTSTVAEAGRGAASATPGVLRAQAGGSLGPATAPAGGGKTEWSWRSLSWLAWGAAILTVAAGAYWGYSALSRKSRQYVGWLPRFGSPSKTAPRLPARSASRSTAARKSAPALPSAAKASRAASSRRTSAARSLPAARKLP